VIAVHERALFDYLTLESSPAFPGDSLIAVEITRTFERKAVVGIITIRGHNLRRVRRTRFSHGSP
jgi:hypothetical protein